ncbi:hypothetical protein PHYSODRAFT_482510, partial [Phytophthora sojae]
WMLVADHNGIPPTTARRIFESGRIKATHEAYLDDNYTYTLAAMVDMVMFDIGVDLSQATSRDGSCMH